MEYMYVRDFGELFADIKAGKNIAITRILDIQLESAASYHINHALREIVNDMRFDDRATSKVFACAINRLADVERKGGNGTGRQYAATMAAEMAKPTDYVNASTKTIKSVNFTEKNERANCAFQINDHEVCLSLTTSLNLNKDDEFKKLYADAVCECHENNAPRRVIHMKDKLSDGISYTYTTEVIRCLNTIVGFEIRLYTVDQDPLTGNNVSATAITTLTRDGLLLEQYSAASVK